MNSTTDQLLDLGRTLDSLAHLVADRGTAAAPHAMTVLAASARALEPHAAAALVDPTLREVVRQRAFGIVHGALLGRLDDVDTAEVLDRLVGRLSGPREISRVA